MSITETYPSLISYFEYLGFEKRYSPHTLLSYQTDLEQFFSFLIGCYDSPSLETINSAMIKSWLAELKEDNLTAKSINRKISALKSYFKYLLKNEIITETPMAVIVSPKINKRLPVFVEEKDMMTLFEHVFFGDDWKGKTERLVMLLFYATGIRISELIHLQDKQIDIGNAQLKVIGKGNKERIIPVDKELVALIESYITEKKANQFNSTNLFVSDKGLALKTNNVYRFVKKYLTLVTTIQKKSPHVLRHSFATHIMNNGGDLNAVKELLGHSSLASTQIYTHTNIAILKETFKKAHPKA